MSEPTQFRIRAWQRPIRYGLLLLNALLFGAPLAAFAHFGLSLSNGWSLVAGLPSAFGVVALILWKDHRPMPEGVLRLLPDGLFYSGDPGAPIDVPLSMLRSVAPDPLVPAVLIHHKAGRRIAIPFARLDAPPHIFMAALNTWIAEAGPLASAVLADRSRRQRVQVVLGWVTLASVVLAVVRFVALLVHG